MRVIISNGGFLPAKTYGGPVVSIDNLCTLLHKEIDFYVICTNHEHDSKERMSTILDGWNDRGNCKVKYFYDSEVNKNNLVKIINEIKPDVLYINSLFDAMWTMPLLDIAKKKGIKVLLAPRGQLCKNAFVGKYKKVPYLWYLRIFGLLNRVHFQSTSDEETKAIKRYLKGDDERIHFLTNLPSLPSIDINHNKKISGYGRFVFYSRIVPKKNLINAIKFFDGIKGKAEFDIYGPIEDKTYWEECKKEVSKLSDNVSVNYKGVIDHDRVFEILSGYDAFLFPTWSENFGHVISEALFSGCPAIISDQTPWRGLKNVYAGWDIGLENKKEFTKAIQEIIDQDNDSHQKYIFGAITFAKKHFDLDKIKKGYIEAFL